MAHSLTKEDKKLWDVWLTSGDPDAYDGLVQLYMPLVHYHVQRVSVGLPRSVRKDDLISHGLFGLFDAFEKFNPNRDLKFDTYASFRIKGAIIDGLRKEDWLPRSMRDKIKKVEATIERLEQMFCRYVTSEEVGIELEMNPEEVEQIMAEHFTSNMLSIDEQAQGSERNETFAATIEDKRTLTPEQKVLKEATMEELTEVISLLTEKEQLVISLFYYEELTLTEIGEVLNLSTSRISQIHSKALFRLQQVLNKHKILQGERKVKDNDNFFTID